MSLVDELNSDGNRWNRAPTPILNTIAMWLFCGLIGLAGLSFGGKGFVIALLGRQTTAEVTGVFTTGGRHETKWMRYRFTLSGGQTLEDSCAYNRDQVEARKTEIRYLSFYPSWSAAIGGSRPFDLFKHFMICVSGGMALGLIWLHRRWQNED